MFKDIHNKNSLNELTSMLRPFFAFICDMILHINKEEVPLIDTPS